MAEEDVRSLWEHNGRATEERVATYKPDPDGWLARVRKVQVALHSYKRRHIAIVDPDGIARYTTFASRWVSQNASPRAARMAGTWA